jgi:hypothetical protein
MTRHLVCLTIDTDPDGLAGRVVDRQTLQWRGLQQIGRLQAALQGSRQWLGRIPITWFVRADGQLRDILGSSLYLFEEFEPLWRQAQSAGDEIGWHPHLYRHLRAADTAVLITEPSEAVEEINRLQDDLAKTPLRLVSFRNGEGWHCPPTFDAVEKLGFRWDSTAVPGRKGSSGHPMDWIGTPNHPYFPDASDIRIPGPERLTAEIPMNTWSFRASYDNEPRVRYINPAIHAQLFNQALAGHREHFDKPFAVWTMILHADEVLAEAAPDLLYARSVEVVCHNLDCFARALREAGHEVEFVTIAQAGAEWRRIEDSRDSLP